jgi:hypothetical protein
LEKANIGNDRVTTFLANAGETRHPFFGNPVVDYAEERLIREGLHCGTPDDIRGVLTTEPVESVASRAFCLEEILSLDVRLQRGSLRFAIRILAKDVAVRAKGNHQQSKCENDSPGSIP